MQDARRTVAALKDQVERFCAEREWDRFHGAKVSRNRRGDGGRRTPRALPVRGRERCGRSDGRAGATSKRRGGAVRRPLFLLRFAQRYGIDLSAAFDRKMASNAARYPVEKARGSKRKYTEL